MRTQTRYISTTPNFFSFYNSCALSSTTFFLTLCISPSIEVASIFKFCAEYPAVDWGQETAAARGQDLVAMTGHGGD